MVKQLALVEDDDVIRANYADLLEQAGFGVASYSSKVAAIQAFDKALPDIALIDVGLGDERDAGFEICAELRRRSPTLPIIFLTSHDADVDRISGLRLGADDYLTKDASIDYVIVRIETLQRRISAVAAASEQKAIVPSSRNQAALTLDEAMSHARWRGRPVDLTLTQFWMLRELFRRGGTVLSHEALMNAAQIVVEQNTVTAHVKAIRDAFRQIDPDFDSIKTERGRGYRWVNP
jgi:two-component system, OmpR family, response regulator